MFLRGEIRVSLKISSAIAKEGCWFFEVAVNLIRFKTPSNSLILEEILLEI